MRSCPKYFLILELGRGEGDTECLALRHTPRQFIYKQCLLYSALRDHSTFIFSLQLVSEFGNTMKLVHKSLERDGAGSIVLVPEETEDMWHAFNLIQEGDAVRASTIRKVTTESNTGSRTSDRVRTILTVQVETIDFDTQVWEGEGVALR